VTVVGNVLLKGLLRVAPKGSQVFVNILALAGILCVLISFVFLWALMPPWWVPLAVGGVLLTVSWVSWKSSHRDADRSGSSPTVIADTRTGLSLSMDPVSAATTEGRRLIARLVTIAANRQPLPEPDGVLAADRSVVPNSKPAAMERAAAIEADAQTWAQSVSQALEQHRQQGQQEALTQESRAASTAEAPTPDVQQQPAE